MSCDLSSVSKRLNKIGSGFCAMKWLHETLYLHTGDNHSCYHPKPQHIPLNEIANNPAALHNTEWKKRQRKKMLEGGRPDECYYCWNIEDLEGKQISDRILHSSRNFAEPIIEDLATLPWNADINPRYLEISFGNGCNYRCGYCSPQASTMWIDEIQKYGNYNLTYNQYGIEFLNNGTYYGPKDKNPYVEAFWQWWPSLKKDLWILRITGGEPLMNPGSMYFLNLLEKEPAPQLDLRINSNLGVSKPKLKKMYDKVESLLYQNKIKKFKLFTSIDTWGPQAEYIRTGLKLNHWEQNLKEALRRGFEVNLMCTFNVLCVTNFINLMEKIKEWRKEFGYESIRFDCPYLKEPPHWMINILSEDFMKYMYNTQNFIANDLYFRKNEQEYFQRVTNYMKTNPVDKNKIKQGQRDFYVFFTENDKRLGTNLLQIFPEYKEFYNYCQDIYLNYTD